VASCKSIGAPFYTQLKRIQPDMLNVYQIISSNLSKAITENGEQVLKQPLVKLMRVVKREILTLLSTWIARAFEGRADLFMIPVNEVMETIIQPLFGTVLEDYKVNVPQAREPKVLSLLSITIVSLKEEASPQILSILDAVFVCTLEMINKDMEGYPEHRTNFYQLMNVINRHCFEVLVTLTDEMFQMIIQSIVWAFKHSMRNVAEIGIEILREMLNKLSMLPDKNQQQIFYQKYFITILEHVLGVLTDSNQVQFIGLTNLSETVCLLFQAAESIIEVPLNPENPAQSNMDFVFASIASLFSTHFKNLTEAQIRVTIKGFFSYNRLLTTMREHIRDFLIQIKEESGEDTADLFLEEKETEIQKIQSEKQSIPGVMNPNDVADEDMV